MNFSTTSSVNSSLILYLAKIASLIELSTSFYKFPWICYLVNSPTIWAPAIISWGHSVVSPFTCPQVLAKSATIS